MIDRIIHKKIKELAGKFPIVLLTGPRQSGKSTLLKYYFPEYSYVSLEEPDNRIFALSDPRGFLSNYKSKTIIDEVQYVPSLFSYIQSIVDKENIEGRFLLSGSQNFLLMQNITQSLAGRVAILKLLPLSIIELKTKDFANNTLNEQMFYGGYPRIFDKDIQPTDFFPNYIQTYIERDVRLLKNITDLSLFVKFLKLCAGRAGQMLNMSDMSNDCGINVATVKSWLSVLEASYIIYFLQPYYKNFNKRLVKTPKMYFFDTGLLCSLLGIEKPEQLSTHYLKGHIFENFVISDLYKTFANTGKTPPFYFWRDNNDMEVDLLIDDVENMKKIEIKSSETFNPKFFDNIKLLNKVISNDTSNKNSENSFVVYGGEQCLSTSSGKLLSWREATESI